MLMLVQPICLGNRELFQEIAYILNYKIQVYLKKSKTFILNINKILYIKQYLHDRNQV